jgi:hypothetical protein
MYEIEKSDLIPNGTLMLHGIINKLEVSTKGATT